MSRKQWTFALVAVAALVAFYAPEAFAQDQTQQRFDGVLNAFRDQSIRWQGTLAMAAKYMFFALALIQFAWTNMRLALKGGDASDFIATNTVQVLGTGIMYVFLAHSFDWSHALVKGFLQAGERAVLASAGGAAGAIDPANVFQNGLAVAGSLFSQMSVWSGLDNLSLVICALVMVVCFAFLAAFMAVVIVESYIIIGGSVLLLGFGGSMWTADIAKRTMMYAVSVGAKLFVMQLIVGVAMGSVIQWAQTYQQDSSTSTLSLIGLVCLVTICAKMIPELVQGILSGVSVGGSSAMVATVAAAISAAGAGAAAAGGGGAAGAAGAAGGAGGGGGGGAALGAAGSGAQGAAAQSGSAGLLSGSAGHLARMGGHIVDAGSGLNPNAAFGPLSSAGRPGVGAANDDADDAGPKPAPPTMPSPGSGSTNSSSGGQSAAAAGSGGEGGVIRGAGAGTGASTQGASTAPAAAQASRGQSGGGQ
ncbi:MAG: P-type conjugative transfer protein TrbL, partial [Burkholderiales bacterium]|nr:P-type conjugative transfer protein TrbL [Burkholderiales bacterium]